MVSEGDHCGVRDLLRSVWYEPHAPDPPRQSWRDWALVGVLESVVVLEGILRPDLPWRVLSVIVAAGLALTLLWRRTRPLLMVAIAFVTSGLMAVRAATRLR